MKMLVRDESDGLPFFDASYVRYSSSHGLFCHDFFATVFFVIPDFPSLLKCLLFAIKTDIAFH